MAEDVLLTSIWLVQLLSIIGALIFFIKRKELGLKMFSNTDSIKNEFLVLVCLLAFIFSDEVNTVTKTLLMLTSHLFLSYHILKNNIMDFKHIDTIIVNPILGQFLFYMNYLMKEEE